MIKTAVIGASGFIGRHLWQSYRTAFPDAVGTSFSTADSCLTSFDIRDPDLASLRLEATGHRAVIIAAAESNVAFCERNREAAYAVNVAGTLELIRQIIRTSLQVIFLSSDYVFEGTAGSYDDDAPANPTTEYGRQKVLIEQQIAALAENHLVLRLSKTFGLRRGDGTILDEMAATLTAGRDLAAAADQFFCPTSVHDVVAAVHAIQQRKLTGTVNICSPEVWSRFAIASAVARALHVASARVRQVSLHDLCDMQDRPLNTSMHCSRLQANTAATFTPLADAIARVAANWKL